MADFDRDVTLKELDHIQAIMGRFDTFFFLMKQVFLAGMGAWFMEFVKHGGKLSTYWILVVPLVFLTLEINFRFWYWARYAKRAATIRDHLQNKTLPEIGQYEIAEPRHNSCFDVGDVGRWRHSVQHFDLIYYGIWAIAAAAAVWKFS